MTKQEIEETKIETTQDQPELNERDLNEVAGGLNFTKTSPPPSAVDMF